MNERILLSPCHPSKMKWDGTLLASPAAAIEDVNIFVSQPFDNFPITIGFKLLSPSSPLSSPPPSSPLSSPPSSSKSNHDLVNVHAIQILNHERFISKYIEIFLGNDAKDFNTTKFQYVGMFKPHPPRTGKAASPGKELCTVKVNMFDCKYLLLRIHRPHDSDSAENMCQQSSICCVNVIGTSVEAEEQADQIMEKKVRHQLKHLHSAAPTHSPRFNRELDATLVKLEQRFELDFDTTFRTNAAASFRSSEDLEQDVQHSKWTTNLLQLVQRCKYSFAASEDFDSAQQMQRADKILQEHHVPRLVIAYQQEVSGIDGKTEMTLRVARLHACGEVVRLEGFVRYCQSSIEAVEAAADVWKGVECSTVEEVLLDLAKLEKEEEEADEVKVEEKTATKEEEEEVMAEGERNDGNGEEERGKGNDEAMAIDDEEYTTIEQFSFEDDEYTFRGDELSEDEMEMMAPTQAFSLLEIEGGGSPLRLMEREQHSFRK